MLSVIHMFQQFGDRAHKFLVREARNACIDILMETGLCKPKKTFPALLRFLVHFFCNKTKQKWHVKAGFYSLAYRNKKIKNTGKHNNHGFKGEVQSRITIISKESIKISLQIGAKMMKIG